MDCIEDMDGLEAYGVAAIDVIGTNDEFCPAAIPKHKRIENNILIKTTIFFLS
jgi:hypothetical protein